MIKKIYRLLQRYSLAFIERKFLNKRFSQIHKYLAEGIYSVNYAKKIFYRNDHQVINYLTTYFNVSFDDARNKTIVQKLNSFLPTSKKVKKARHEEVLFKGSFVLFSNKLKSESQYGDVKLFDFDKSEILTSYFSASSYQKKLHDTLYFQKYYNTPVLLSFSDDELITIEKLIDYIPLNDFTKENYLKTTNDILVAHLGYFKECNVGQSIKYIKPNRFFEYENCHPDNVRSLLILQSLIGEAWQKTDLPLIYQHGDLSYSNILLSKTDRTFLIDWEHASYYTFFYDIMWPWQNEAINKNNYFLIKCYLNGVFDKCLVEIFSVFGFEFKPSYRVSYFSIMLSELVYHRILKRQPSIYNPFLNDRLIPMLENVNLIFRTNCNHYGISN